MDTLTDIIQQYIGAVPTDKGCSTWAELQSKMEKEITEITIPKPKYGSGLLMDMRARDISGLVDKILVDVFPDRKPPEKVDKPTELTYDGYCVKCKAKKVMHSTKQVELKNKRIAIKGLCPDCGTGMFKILGKA